MTALLCLLGSIGVLTPAERDSLLEETHGNRDVWCEAFETLSGDELWCAEYLFGSVPRLDRLEMTTEALNDHIRGALDRRDAFGEELSDSIFLKCVLEYRVDQEPVSAYRSALREYWKAVLPALLPDPHETALMMVNMLEERIEIEEQGYLGGVAPPLVVLAAGSATPVECTVVLCASLRSMGVASRQIVGWFGGEEGGTRRWVEVYSREGVWRPLTVPWEPVPIDFEGLALAVWETTGGFVTGSLTETGRIVVIPPEGLAAGEWTGTVSLPVNGGFIPLDWAWFDPTQPDTVELGAGDYLVCVSTRTPEGHLRIFARDVKLEPHGEHVIHTFP
ncbi:MAG: transglutaminase-like domain-containing protein [Candidatus Fermentibacteraceae bacterium]